MVASKKKYATFDQRNWSHTDGQRHTRWHLVRQSNRAPQVISEEAQARRAEQVKSVAAKGREIAKARKLPVVDPDAAWHGTSEGWVDRLCGCIPCRRWGLQEKERQRIARAKAHRRNLAAKHHHNANKFKVGPNNAKAYAFAREVWSESDRRIRDREWNKMIDQYEKAAERRKRRQGAPPFAGKLCGDELKRLRLSFREAGDRMGLPGPMVGAFVSGKLQITYMNDHVVTRFAEVFREVTSRSFRNRMAHYGFEPNDLQRYLFHVEAMHRAWNSRVMLGGLVSDAERADHAWRVKPKVLEKPVDGDG